MKNDNPAGRNEIPQRLCRSLRDAVEAHHTRRHGITKMPKLDLDEKMNALLVEGAKLIRAEFPYVAEKEAREIFAEWSIALLLKHSDDEIRAMMASQN